MNHATKLFPIAVSRLIEIGEKARKQREQRERAKHVALPRETGACKHAMHEEKQLKLELQTRI
jgi:hypothetical protein